MGDIHVEDLLVLSSVLRLTLGRYTCRGPACIVQCFEANSWKIYNIHVEDLLVLSSVLRLTLGRYTIYMSEIFCRDLDLLYPLQYDGPNYLILVQISAANCHHNAAVYYSFITFG